MTATRLNPLSVYADEPYKSKSVPSATWTNLNSVELSAGKWLVIASAEYDTNATGNRRCRIQTTGQAMTCCMAAASGSATVVPFYHIMDLSATQTVYVTGYQNSGSSITGYGRITAVRLA